MAGPIGVATQGNQFRRRQAMLLRCLRAPDATTSSCWPSFHQSMPLSAASVSPVLSSDQHRQMAEQGYTIVHDAVTPADLAAVVDDIWSHTEGMKRDDRASWYPERGGALPDRSYGFQRLFHTPAMWRVRQSPRIHAAFAELWGTEKLWVSLDRTMLKVPVQQGHPGGDLLHWDFDVRAERRRFKLFQATLFLEDCARDQGTFQCVRGFQTKYEEWRGQTSDAELDEIMSSNRVPCAPEFEPTVVAGKAGDLLIWDTFMPHGHTFNTSDRVRLNQFLTMYPCEDEAIYRDALRVMWPNSAPSHDGSDLGDVCGGLEAERKNRVEQWQLGCVVDYPPSWPNYDFSSGWPESELKPNGHDQPRCPLSTLGRRLLGLDRWPN